MKVIAVSKEPFSVETLEDATSIAETSVGSVTMITVTYGRDESKSYNPDNYLINILAE